MVRRWVILCAAAAALVAAVAGAAQPATARQVGGGCFQRHLYFDVTGVSLDERVTAHWEYHAADSDFNDLRATLDTVEIGNVDWHEAHAPKAQRRRLRQIAQFDELRGQCLLLDMRQGQIQVKVPMAYTIDGTWTAGAQSGTCHDADTAPRTIFAPFYRLSRSLSPKIRRFKTRWQLNQTNDLDCPFTGFDSSSGVYAPAHLRTYRFTYSDRWRKQSKAPFLHHRVIKLPIDLTSTVQNTGGGSLPAWDYGKVTRTMHITGTVTLRWYKTCVITPRSDISKLACGSA